MRVVSLRRVLNKQHSDLQHANSKKESVHWIQVAQESASCQPLMNTLMYLRVH
jgi:hypothetical protein